MAPLIAEANNLGEAHRNFNSKVNEALIKDHKFSDIKTEYGDSDYEQLMKIEIAAKTKNVDFIIDVLKSNDMLHVSRAIKKSTWLITDDQHSHIINPEYLHEQLFPHMRSKAVCKLLLHIRLNLKDENRVDKFYKYYEVHDLDSAVKWLQNCSLEVIIEATKKHSKIISSDLLKRLCKRSFKVFHELSIRNFTPTYDNYRTFYKDLIFLLHVDTEKYLGEIEKQSKYNWPQFNKKYTAVIMQKCPKRIIDNFEKYAENIDIETFGRYLGPQNIKQFIIDQSKKEFAFILKYKNVKPLIKLMPKEDKFDFLKEFFINKKYKEVEMKDDDEDEGLMCEMSATISTPRKLALRSGKHSSSSQHIYQWYRHAPFETALSELKKLIRIESSPDERGAIFRVLLTSAGCNKNNIKTLLKYYIERHMNEPFKFKIHFINAVLSTTETHKYDDDMWKMLQQLFYSMEVYIDSDNNVQNCVEAIIIYNIVHEIPIPEIIRKKFSFSTLKNVQRKLTTEEKEKVFNYLYKIMEEKLEKESFEDAYDFVSCIEDAFNLLIDWDKDLINFPYILEKSKEIMRKDEENSMLIENSIYSKNKTWSKYFFEESLLVAQTPKVCLNIIKHDIHMLEKYESKVEDIRCNDKYNLRSILTKLHVFWPDTIAQQWIKSYKDRIDEFKSQKSLVRGLCYLLPHKELLEFLQTNAPKDFKINWSENDDTLFGLQKNCAQLMHCARPQPPPSAVLQYAMGDYLQFALSSLLSIYYNLSAIESREHLPKILNNVVSLKKHGIRLAISKLNCDELKDILLSNWESTKNASIRAVIFKETFNMLCHEKNAERINEIWNLLQHIVNNLGSEENKEIYVMLGNVSDLPESVQPQFCAISYKLLSSLPAKANCEAVADEVCLYTAKIMDKMDNEFMQSLLLKFLNDWFGKKKVSSTYSYGYPDGMLNVISTYVLWTDDKEQMRRFNNVYNILLEQSMKMWNLEYESQRVVKSYFCQALETLFSATRNGLESKKCPIPVDMFKKILETITEKLSVIEDYEVITHTKFLVLYMECCAINKDQFDAIEVKEDSSNDKDDDKEDIIWDKVNIDFAKRCIEILRDDIGALFPSIVIPFIDTLKQFYGLLSCQNDLDFAKAMMEDHDFVPAYIAATAMADSWHMNYNADESEYKAKLAELRKIILSHPSKEVQLHYYKKVQL